ncbi:AF4/FMR2 family member 2 [Eucyclogobius newberryi]|uniref:AF4/FMR2 family member 2 n=1 Tax=Eucyclogobius newberryi TaxID=166745 RepID=UPI003B5CA9F2
MDLFELDFFRDWDLEQPCHVESERSALKRREWERRTQEVQQDDDLFSSGFNLFGEPYKTSKGDALASRVQNTLGSYEEMKDLLTNQSNQTHLVGIPKGGGPNSLQTPPIALQTPPTAATTERAALEQDTSVDRRANMQPPLPAGNATGASKKARGGAEWARGHAGVTQGSGGGQREKQKQEEPSGPIRDELRGDGSPASSASSAGRRHKTLPVTDGGLFRSLDGGHLKSSSENVGLLNKTSPFEHESPLASTSVLATPTPILTTPTPGLTTPTFPPGQSLSGKPMSLQQKPTAYVRPMDGQDQAPNASPQLKPPLVVTEGYSSGPSFGGNGTSVKNKLPKLTLAHTAEVSVQNDPSCVEEILREMTHSWPPPLTAIHTPVKAEHTKFPVLNKVENHKNNSVFVSERCSVAASKPSSKAMAPQKSMLEDDLKISSDEEESETQMSEKKVRNSVLSGASGSSSESESSSESDTDESESSSSDITTPEPEPPSSSKWQLDSWLNKVQAQPRAAAPPQDTHGTALYLRRFCSRCSAPQASEPFSPESEAPVLGAVLGAVLDTVLDTAGKSRTCVSSSSPGASTAEHKDGRAAFSVVREKSRSKLGQKGATEAQRAKVHLSPGVVSGSEVGTPRRATTGRKQPRRDDRSSHSVTDESANNAEEQELSWSRAPPSPVSRDKDLSSARPPELLAPKPRIRPQGGKTAPRKEPRTTANANHANSANATALPAPVTPVSSSCQERRKHRGPSTKTTPKSREFIETSSSSSSSESPSGSEENVTKASHQTLPPAPPLASRGITSGGKGLRLKETGAIANGSVSSGAKASGHGHFGVANISGPFGISVPDPGGSAPKNPGQFSPGLVVSEIPSPRERNHQIQSLWVEIDLSLLSRVPGRERGQNGGLGERARHDEWARERETFVKERRDEEEEQEEEEDGEREREGHLNLAQENNTRFGQEREKDRGDRPKHNRPKVAGTNQKHKSKRKHKSNHSETNGSKKLRLDKETLLPPCISPIHKSHPDSISSFSRKRPRDDKLLPPLLSPLSDEPPRRNSCESGPGPGPVLGPSPVLGPGLVLGSGPGLVPEGSSSVSSSSSSHRHRRGENKNHRTTAESEPHSDKSSADGYNPGSGSDSEVWTETLEPTEASRPRISFSDTVHSADFHMQEAKRLKHKADKLMEKFGKAVNYADGALSFIQCGNAMERDPLEAKSPYTMYSETVELLRYAMRLKNFIGHSSSTNEKKLAVLCHRCLSLLYLRMFQLKKDHALKYSRTLMEYFKNSAKGSQQSPWRTNGKVNGAPSPLAISPSPAGNGAGPGSGGGVSVTGTGSVSIPQRIHHMASSHVTITNNILRSYETWETAERLTAECSDFFVELDSVMKPLTQQSSMSALVRYVRQGLTWLRIDTNLT